MARSDVAPGLLSRGVTLEYSDDGSTWTDIPDLQEFPDIGGGTPDMVEVTTLEDEYHRYIPGLKGGDNESLEFTFLYTNYTNGGFVTCLGLAGKDMRYRVSVPDGTTFTWQGQMSSPTLVGTGTNEALQFTAAISLGSGIEVEGEHVDPSTVVNALNGMLAAGTSGKFDNNGTTGP